MSATSWSSVSEGRSTPGAPVTAVFTGPDRLALFVADPLGGIFTTSGSAEAGWAPWSTVSEGRTMPGAPIAAITTDVDRVALFVADPLGGVFTTSGSAEAGWAPWSTVSEGQTTPGGHVTAKMTSPDRMELFVADRLGGVFTTSRTVGGPWKQWSSVSEGQTTPGAPVTAVVTGPRRVALFLADPLGGVFTTTGSAEAGWAPWTTVSEGRTTSGGTVTGVMTGGGHLTLFLADPLGGVFATTGNGAEGWAGWSSVSEGRTTPGAPVTAASTSGGPTLFLADPLGGIFTTTGSVEAGWGLWTNVSQGQTMPGAQVSAVLTGPDRVALFIADPSGGIFTSSAFRNPQIPFVYGTHNLAFVNPDTGVPSLRTFADTFGAGEIASEIIPIWGHPFLLGAFFAFYRDYLKGEGNDGRATGFCTSVASLVADNFWTGRTDTHNIVLADVHSFLTTVHGKLLSKESIHHFHSHGLDGVARVERSCREVETTFIQGARRDNAPLLFFIPVGEIWGKDYFEKLNEAHCVMPYRFAYPAGHTGPRLSPDGTTTVSDLHDVELFVWDCNRPEDPNCKVIFGNVDGQLHFRYPADPDLSSQNGFTLSMMTNGDYLLSDHDLPFGGQYGVERFIFDYVFDLVTRATTAA